MMKNIIIFLSPIFFSLSIQAQSGVGSVQYDTCDKIRQFEGEWLYAQGNDTIRIFLRYHRKEFSKGARTLVKDVLTGWHEYKIANVTVQSDYANRYVSLQTDADMFFGQYSIFLLFDKSLNTCNVNSRALSGSITDFLQGGQQKDVFVTVNTAGNQMVWKQRHQEWVGHGSGLVGMTLPSEFTLMKQ